MFFRLLFLLTFIPFIEIYFLIQLSDRVGFANTIWLVLLTGVLGAALLRRQGASILQELQQHQQGLPTDAIAKGFFTFVGGLLLLTPGILTDFIGLSLIFPLTQILWKKYFMGQWERGVKSGTIHVHTFGGFGQRPPQGGGPELRRPHRGSDVIDITAQKSQTIHKKED